MRRGDMKAFDNELTNYYEILEISTNASPEDIHSGYLRAKNTYSLDALALYSIMSENECTEMLELIETAYSVLSVPAKREEYNKTKGIDAKPKKDAERSTSKGIFSSSRPMSVGEYADTQHFMDFQINHHDAHVSKISATKRFSLEYKKDLDFEQKIESTQTYTGDLLKQIREYKNVSIDRMSDLIKVSKTYIKQIEADEFDRLPAKTYVRGFVYQYAKCLKLNPDIVATSYLNHIGEIQKQIKK